MGETESKALDLWEEVIGHRDAWFAKTIPVVITSGRSGDPVTTRLNEEPEGMGTAKDLVYINPRSADDINDLTRAMCRCTRRADVELDDLPASLQGESGRAVAPSDVTTTAVDAAK